MKWKRYYLEYFLLIFLVHLVPSIYEKEPKVSINTVTRPAVADVSREVTIERWLSYSSGRLSRSRPTHDAFYHFT